MKTILIFMLLILSFTKTEAQNYNGNKKDINKILHNIKTFSQYYINADYDAIADSYTTDGKIFPNNADIITGREAIKKRWILPSGVKILKHKIIPVEITITGNTAYDYGYYEGQTLTAKNEKASWRGKYVIVWKKISGKWKIYLDIWNRIKS